MRNTKRSKQRSKIGQPWTEAEITSLVDLYPDNSTMSLANKFGRTGDAIRGQARKLGLKKNQNYLSNCRRQQAFQGQPWSTSEMHLLVTLYPTIPNEEIAQQIGRTPDAIQSQAKKIGLVKMEFWTDEENRLLKKLYQRSGYEELARRLGRSTRSVMARTQTLGLDKKVQQWTKQEVRLLKELYHKTDAGEIAKMLGRTLEAIQIKASRIGLTNNDAKAVTTRLQLHKVQKQQISMEKKHPEVFPGATRHVGSVA